MKPRERKRQKQTSRMFLRTKDHRDIIFDDKYHNFIWGNVSNIDDELVWQKYPDKAVVLGVSPYTGAGAIANAMWLDVERHMLYQIYGNPYINNVYATLRVKDFILTYVTSGVQTISWTEFLTSKDGMIFQHDLNRFTYTIPNYQLKWLGTGNKACTYIFNSGQSTATFDVFEFEYDEETEETEVTRNTYTLNFPEVSYSSFYLGNTESGGIIARRLNGTSSVPQYFKFYHVSDNGFVNEVFSWLQLSPDNIPNSLGYGDLITNSNDRNQMVKVGTNYFIGNVWRDLSVTSTYKYYWRILYCNGDITDWKIAPLDFFTTNAYSSGVIAVFARGERVYAYCGDAYNDKNVKLFCTTDYENWFEMNLPEYKDIPLEEYGGQSVEIPSGGYDYVRVKFKSSAPNASDGYNVSLYDGINGYYLNSGQNALKQGEIINSDSDDDFGVAFQIGRILIYSPTPEFLPDDNLQAFYINSSNDGIPYDFVMEGDYVL